MLSNAGVSVILPTFQREELLVATVRSLAALVRREDEILVVDQTPVHEPTTEVALRSMAEKGQIRWLRRDRPSQCEAMNLAAHLAKNDILLFLDDDVVPAPGLIEGHRSVLAGPDPPPATCGQVLQPWDAAPISEVAGFDLDFSFAYDQPCEIRTLIAANFGIRKDVYFAVGGMDENFVGANYRNDAEIAFRICARTGKRLAFVPSASLRHLLSGGGNRAFGGKDSWGHMGASAGDYYFALKWLRGSSRIGYIIRRLAKEPLNRNTIRRPWIVVLLYLREIVALARASRLWRRRDSSYIRRELKDYGTPVDGRTGKSLVW